MSSRSKIPWSAVMIGFRWLRCRICILIWGRKWIDEQIAWALDGYMARSVRRMYEEGEARRKFWAAFTRRG